MTAGRASVHGESYGCRLLDEPHEVVGIVMSGVVLELAVVLRDCDGLGSDRTRGMGVILPGQAKRGPGRHRRPRGVGGGRPVVFRRQSGVGLRWPGVGARLCSVTRFVTRTGVSCWRLVTLEM